MEELIFSLLSPIGTPVYLDHPPQDSAPITEPYIVYSRNDTEPTLCLGGTAGGTRYSYTLDLWANDFPTLRDLMDECKAALHGYKDGTVQGIFLKDTTTEQEEPTAFKSHMMFFLYASD